VLFRRKKYPLPKFPDNVAGEFRSLCEVLPEERVVEFIPEVQECIDHFIDLAQRYPMIDVPRVREIGRVSVELLTSYPNCSPKQKRLIIGAVRYFASTDDAVSETAFASGLDDDVRVLNHVCEILGREDLYLAE
jgi:hypothetical protein